MAPIDITVTLIMLVAAIVVAANTARKLRWAPLALVVAAFVVIAVHNFINPHKAITLGRKGLAGICETSAARPGKTTPNTALPPELRDGVQAVEATHKPFDWFCGG